MHYQSFRIRNFKGIKDTTIHLQAGGLASVFAFVGLNESGKTTILEAIHSFNPDTATSELVGGGLDTGVPYKDRVPRHMVSTFTGDVSVAATLHLTQTDKDAIQAEFKEKAGLDVNPETLPSSLTLERTQRFKRGDIEINYFTILHSIEVRAQRSKNGDDSDRGRSIRACAMLFMRAPLI